MTSKIVTTPFSWAWAAKLDNTQLALQIKQKPAAIAQALAKELFSRKPSPADVDLTNRVLPLFEQEGVPESISEKLQNAVYHRLLARLFLAAPTDELSMACKQNQSETAKELIREGAPVHVYDPERNTPLYYACLNMNEELAVLLVKGGAQFSRTLPQSGWLSEMVCRNRLDGLFRRMIEEQVDLDHLLRPDGSPAMPLQHFFQRKGNLYPILQAIPSDTLFSLVSNFLTLTPEQYLHIPPLALATIMMSDLRVQLFQCSNLDFLHDEKMIVCAQIVSKVFSEEEMIEFLDKLTPSQHQEFVQAIVESEELADIRQSYSAAHPEFEEKLDALHTLSQELRLIFEQVQPWPTADLSASELLRLFRNCTLSIPCRLEALYLYREQAGETIDGQTLLEFKEFCTASQAKLSSLFAQSARAPSEGTLISCWLEDEEIAPAVQPIKEYLPRLIQCKSRVDNILAALNARLHQPETEDLNTESLTHLYENYSVKFEALKEHLQQLTPNCALPSGLDYDEVYRLYFGEDGTGSTPAEIRRHIGEKRKEWNIMSMDDLLETLQRPAKKSRQKAPHN